MIAALVEDSILLVAFILIFAFLLLSIIGLRFPTVRFFQIITSTTESNLTSIGIFFTFLGIFIALSNFDSNNIQDSIPRLLDGLSLAFGSSVFGLFSALIFRIVFRPTLTVSGRSEGATADDILEELKNLNETNLSVREAISGEGDGSLSTQIGKLRIDFQDFAKKVGEDGANALIKALEEVIKDFNEKINEQFGENFKQLNEAVEKLLVWQQEYKEQVSILTEAFRVAQSGISEIESKVRELGDTTGRIPDQINEFEKVFDRTDARMTELYEGLSSLSEMRQHAVDALPIIEKNIENMTGGIENVVNQQSEKFTGVLDSLNIHADKLLETGDQFAKKVEEQIIYFSDRQTQFTNDLESTLGDTADKIDKTMSESTRSLEGNIQDTLKQINQLMQQSTEALDKSMQDELNRSLEIMAKNLTAVTKAFVDQYEPFAQRLEAAMRNTRA